jgi:hypothetical protein
LVIVRFFITGGIRGIVLVVGVLGISGQQVVHLLRADGKTAIAKQRNFNLLKYFVALNYHIYFFSFGLSPIMLLGLDLFR